MAFERLHFDISFSDLGSTSRSHWHQKDKTEEKRVNFNSVVVFSLCLSKFCLIKFKLCAVLDVNEVCIVYTHKKSDYHFMIRIHAHEKDWEWETDQGRKKVSMSLMYNIILVWGTQKTSWHTSVYKNKHRYARYFFQVTICLHIFLQASCCLHWDCSKDTVLHCIFPFWMCHPSICGTRWVWLFFWFACLLFIWMWVTWSFPFFASSRLHFYRAMLANTWVRCWVVSSVFNKCVNSKQNYFLTKLAHVDSCV